MDNVKPTLSIYRKTGPDERRHPKTPTEILICSIYCRRNLKRKKHNHGYTKNIP